MATSPEILTDESEASHDAVIQSRIQQRLDTRDATTARDVAFQEIVVDRLVTQVENDLEAAGIEPETAAEVIRRLGAVEERESLEQMLTVPFELRRKRYARYAADQLDAATIVATMAQSTENDRTRLSQPILGFHTTLRQVPVRTPRVGRDAGVPTWVIKGTETSDYSEAPQAYAARRYRDLYREKPVRWLYVVRDFSANSVEPSRGWSRAPSFSVVAEMPLPDIDAEVKERAERVLAAGA